MRFRSILFLGLVLIASSCKQVPGNKVNPPTAAPQGNAPAVAATGSGDVVARINGIDVTDSELTESVKSKLKRVESQIFEIKRDGLSDLVEAKLIEAEAKKRNVSVDELLKQEVKAEDPTQEEVESFYELNKDRMGGQTLDKIKPQIERQLKMTRLNIARNKFLEQLKANSTVEILMERPRVTVSADDDPSIGPKDAPIQIVEFSEFQCPFCGRARATVDQILETYKGQVHYTFRDFPLSFHKNAPKAAEAAHCAGEQDKYWEYNKKLFENQKALDPDNLKSYAKDIGINADKFTKCLDSGKFAAEVEKDMEDGSAVGVSGTPAYFVNGIFISGAQPFANFKEIIDEELARAKRK